MGQWKPGDVVVLKSGGPTMTVANVRQDGKVVCEWFDDNKPQGRAFDPDVLEPPPPPGPATYTP